MKLKRIISTVMAVIIILGTFSVSAAAVTVKIKTKYAGKSTYVPVTFSTKKSASTIYLYGNADYLCLRAKSDSSSDLFEFSIYSDSAYKKKIDYTGFYCKKGKTEYNILPIDLTSFKSGTYYGMTCVYKTITNPINKKSGKDPATVVKFKIVINRKGTSIKNTNTVMYGFENTSKGPRIYWYSVPNATGYYLYRYDNGEYKKIKTIKNNKKVLSSYIDTSLVNKCVAKAYKIVAYNSSGNSKKSYYSCKAYFVPTPTFSISSSSNDQLIVEAKYVGNNCGYTLYCRTADSDWKRCSSGGGETLTASGLKNNTLYYFTVVADNTFKVGNTTKTFSSDYNRTGIPYLFLSEPKTVNTASADNGINISWSSVKGAESYNIYRINRTQNERKWSLLQSGITETAFTDTTAEKNTRYYYRIRPFNGNYSGSYSSMGYEGISFDNIVLNDIIKDANGRPVISWSFGKNRDSDIIFKIYRKAGNGDWKYLRQVAYYDFSYTDTSKLTAGEDYSYTVQAVCNSFSSDYDLTGKSIKYYPVVKQLSAEAGDNGLNLIWKKEDIAEKYYVYKKSADGDFVLLGESDTENYTDTTAVEGEIYTYKVCYSYNGELIDSSFSTEINAGINNKTVNINSEYLFKAQKSYSAPSSTYTFTIKDYNSSSRYRLYKKVDGKWIRTNFNQNQSAVTPAEEAFGTRFEYAVTEVTSDGLVSKIGDNTFTLSYFNSAANLKLKIDGFTGEAKLTWDAVEGCTSYDVYRDGEFVKTVEEPVFTETLTEADKNYTYTISAKDGLCFDKTSVSAYYIYVPKFKVKNASCSVRISWSAGKNVDSYYIYRRKANETKWTFLKKVIANSYDDSTAENNMTYYYTIRSCKNGVLGGYDKTGLKVQFLWAPQTRITLTSNSVKLNWNANEYATSYIIYRQTNNSKWVALKTVSPSVLTYNDKNVNTTDIYNYAVVAVGKDTKSAYRITNDVNLVPPVKLKSAVSTKSGITLKWSGVSKASGYYVYRKTTGGWTRLTIIGSGKTVSYIDKTAKKGTTYTYTVRARSGNCLSANSNYVKCKDVY